MLKSKYSSKRRTKQTKTDRQTTMEMQREDPSLLGEISIMMIEV